MGSSNQRQPVAINTKPAYYTNIQPTELRGSEVRLASNPKPMTSLSGIHSNSHISATSGLNNNQYNYMGTSSNMNRLGTTQVASRPMGYSSMGTSHQAGYQQMAYSSPQYHGNVQSRYFFSF